jgi:hypothetical protein
VSHSYRDATEGELLGAPLGRRESVAGWFWFADTDGRFSQVVVTRREGRESLSKTSGGYMLTGLEARLAQRAAASPADRTYTPAILPPSLPEPPRRPVAARKTTARPAGSRLGRGVLAAGLAMIPWVFILACSLPSTTRAVHWSTAWAGLDALEAVGLMTTGVALIGRRSWLCLPAAITSALLVVDAWFDITTSAPGPAATVAIAMAVFPELPMAGLCAVLAIRHAPGCTARRAAATTSRETENSSSGGLTKQWRLSPDAVEEILSEGSQP